MCFFCLLSEAQFIPNKQLQPKETQIYIKLVKYAMQALDIYQVCTLTPCHVYFMQLDCVRSLNSCLSAKIQFTLVVYFHETFHFWAISSGKLFEFQSTYHLQGADYFHNSYYWLYLGWQVRLKIFFMW